MNKVLDAEWIELINEALEMGLSPADIMEFLKGGNESDS